MTEEKTKEVNMLIYYVKAMLDLSILYLKF